MNKPRNAIGCTALAQIRESALNSKIKRLAVAGADSEEVLKAVSQAMHQGFIAPILIGHKNAIRSGADKIGLDLSGVEIIEARQDADKAAVIAQIASENLADMIMKGNISTPVLLRALLAKNEEMKKNLLSHIALVEIPSYHKLFIVTDSGVVIRPNLEQKTSILHNALWVTRRLGVKTAKVGILAANEKVSEKMPETVDAVGLVQKAGDGEFGDAIVEGPMALDIAFSTRAAKVKNFNSRVSGDPDILLVPDVASGNIFAKALVYLASAKVAGIVAGGTKPMILVSRAERAETWLSSIALAALVSE